MTAVIVGGGLAGAACATLLARAGREALVIEREAAPAHKICGEFLSAEAHLHLGRLGLDIARLGGHPIARLRLVRGDRVVSAPLGFRGIGLTRRALDEALLAHAEAAGARVLRGHTAHLVDGTAATLRVAGLADIAAAPLFLATGKHELRGLARQPRRPPENLVGFKSYFALSPDQHSALSGHVEVMLFRDGYAGLQRVEGELANLCLLVRRERLDRVGGDRMGGGWPALLAALRADCPHLDRRLAGAVEMLARPLSIYRVPYGHVHADTADEAFRLGDQMAVIPSFSGDGMSIALHSAAVAARSHLAGDPARVYHARMRQDIAAQIRRAGALYRVGRTAPGQIALMRLAERWPGALRLAARLTRVPDHAVRAALAA
jgi:flavin-dependent dehydrogenase